MLDASHYGWLPAGVKPKATTLPRIPSLWRADVPQHVALAAPRGDKTTAVLVHANHGRWIVECPDCHDAQLAVRDDRWFMCVGCANAAVGGVWRPVAWPRTHAKIEAHLDTRPVHNQNWEPGETLADLEQQAREAGL